MEQLQKWLKDQTVAAWVVAFATVGLMIFAGLEYLAPKGPPVVVTEAGQIGQRATPSGGPWLEAALLLIRADLFLLSGDNDKARQA